MLRDKDYLITKDGLVFNVIGYDHAPDRATANLKYVQDGKWTAGYAAAVAFLAAEFPDYIDGSSWVAVPHALVQEIHRPQEGLHRLRVRRVRSALQQAAIDLAQECSDRLEIPIDRFGVTDSLLWGRGNQDSDVDLVVYGRDNAAIVLERMCELFQCPKFERLTRDNFSRQVVSHDVDITELCKRKLNKGLYQGVRFSLRAVREYEEIEPAGLHCAVGTTEMRGRVADNSESLFFPVTYTLDGDISVVSYLMQHEALFGVGERLSIRGNLERGEKERVVVGSLNGRGHKIELASEP